jgi:hypothetical protein
MAEPPPWPLGVVQPPTNSKIGVVETTHKSLEGGSATPVWPRAGFGQTILTGLRGARATPHFFNFFFYFFFFKKKW